MRVLAEAKDVEALDPLNLGLQMVGNCLMWVLGTERWSSGEQESSALLLNRLSSPLNIGPHVVEAGLNNSAELRITRSSCFHITAAGIQVYAITSLCDAGTRTQGFVHLFVCLLIIMVGSVAA